MSRNYQRIVEKIIHSQCENIDYLDIVEFEDSEGPMTQDECSKVYSLLKKSHVMVYW